GHSRQRCSASLCPPCRLRPLLLLDRSETAAVPRVPHPLASSATVPHRSTKIPRKYPENAPKVSCFPAWEALSFIPGRCRRHSTRGGRGPIARGGTRPLPLPPSPPLPRRQPRGADE